MLKYKLKYIFIKFLNSVSHRSGAFAVSNFLYVYFTIDIKNIQESPPTVDEKAKNMKKFTSDFAFTYNLLSKA